MAHKSFGIAPKTGRLARDLLRAEVRVTYEKSIESIIKISLHKYRAFSGVKTLARRGPVA